MKVKVNKSIMFDRKWYFRVFDRTRVWMKRFLTRIGMRDKQSCKYCGRDQYVIWRCSDGEWEKIPKEYRDDSLCLECFVSLHKGELGVGDIEIMGFVDSDLFDAGTSSY